MKRYIFFALVFSLIFLASACSSGMEDSFQTMADSSSYDESVLATDKHFEIDIDLENIEDLCDTTVLEDNSGRIILKTAEFVSSNSIDLQFEAHGVIDENQSTILTACAYDEGFLQGQVSVTPSENAIAKYSLQTAEFEDFGNRFSISVCLPDQNTNPLKTINLKFSELQLISFTKI